MSAELESLPVAGKYYGDRATGYDEKRLSKEAFHNDQFVIQTFLKGVVAPGYNVLDVACGTNRISDFIRELGGNYHGVDISSDMVNLAKEKDPESDIRVADAREIPHPDQAFDLVMSIKFLKWLPDDATLEQVVQEVSRVLKPGGLALLHQKIAAGAPKAKRGGLGGIVSSLLRGQSRQRQKDSPEIRTRAASEEKFLELCARNNLGLKFSAMTSPAARVLRKSRMNAFYVLAKTE